VIWLEKVAGQPNENFPGKKLRSTPIKVEVNTVLVIDRLVFEIVSEADNGEQFMSRPRVEKGIAASVESIENPSTVTR
jgi:hypothetical protein